MSNTYTQIHLHFVFAVKYRVSLIQNDWKDELYKYITGIISNQNHKLLAINGMPDHIHILIGMRPNQSISDLMQDVKSGSAKWINEKGFVKGRFEWQGGYGAFSYGASQVDNVVKYIQNQESHHAKKTFKKEYIDFLEAFGVEYDQRYVFKELV